MPETRKPKRMWLLIVGLLIAIPVVCGIVYLLLRGGAPHRESRYLTMRDGTRLAVDVWLPAHLKAGQKVPTILRAARYWRGYEPGPAALMLRLMGQDPDSECEAWTRAGYAAVTIDVRGSGASFGQWPYLWSQAEQADLGEVVDWIIDQPWSDGQVGAYGVSYEGNTAELVAALNHPAVKAVAPQYADFDVQFHLSMPGGVLNQWFMKSWDEFTRHLDANDVCILASMSGTDCGQMKNVIKGVRPVDGDLDHALLDEAVADHQDARVWESARNIEYRDDTWGETGVSLGDMSPYSKRESIEASGVPMYVWASWLDSASVEGAIARYLTFDNPQQLIFGPWSHGGGYHADPFLPSDTPAEPSPKEQFQMLVDFFDAHMKAGDGGSPETGVTYYTLGEGAWKNSPTWPPAGFPYQSWYFGAGGSLTPDPPAGESDVDDYVVDWTATTGDMTRWHTGLAKTDVIYPDRAAEDEKLLAYTSRPMETDVEITGSPLVTLYVTSTQSDAALHVYLEDVAPDGRVTYVTEGILRAVHRLESEGEPPYTTSGPYFTYALADASPLVPGEVAEIRFNLYATSVLIEQGHRIRIAVAGHDASVFARYPQEGTPEITLQRNSTYPSHIDLPMKIR